MQLILLMFLWGVLTPLLANESTPCTPMKIVTLTEASAIKPIEKVVVQAYKNINREIEVVHLPAKRALIEAQQNDWVDGELIRIDTADKELTNFIRVPVELMKVDVVIYSNASINDSYTWADLKGHKVASMRGLIHLEHKISQHALNDMQLVTRGAQLFKLLAANRVDLVILPKPVGEGLLSGNENYQFNEKVLETISLYHYLHKRHSNIVEPLSNELSRLINR